jgi:hypothetical protein
MPAVSLATQAAGAASSTVGSYYSARTSKTNLELQSSLADTNAKIAELGAQSALMQGEREEQKSRLQTAQLKSTQRTAMAANGIDLGEGSAAQVLTSTDLMGEIDASTIKANAARSAWGYRTQAVNEQNQATMSRAAASAISPGGYAFGSLLGSAGDVAKSWYQFKKEGAAGFGGSSSTSKPSTSSSWW